MANNIYFPFGAPMQKGRCSRCKRCISCEFSLPYVHIAISQMLDKTRSKDGIIDPHILCGYYRLLRKLSVQSTTLPSFLFLFGISCTGDDRLDPRGVGGFSDIFYGTYGGTPVALKRLRFPTRDRYTRKYHIVSSLLTLGVSRYLPWNVGRMQGGTYLATIASSKHSTVSGG